MAASYGYDISQPAKTAKAVSYTHLQPDGFGLMEAGYSVGLAIGILVFFNHIAVKKLNTDPTPLEVEMRLYEENICKTLIDQAGRKEKEIDVD